MNSNKTLRYKPCSLSCEVNYFPVFLTKISAPFLISHINFLQFPPKTALHFPNSQSVLTHFIKYYHHRGINSLLTKPLKTQKGKAADCPSLLVATTFFPIK